MASPVVEPTATPPPGHPAEDEVRLAAAWAGLEDDRPRPRPALDAGPVTLAESLVQEAGWHPLNFGETGPHPPYLRIGGKLWITLSSYEPCFVSFVRDRFPFRSKVAMAAHLRKYDQLMVDPMAFEECYGPGEGTEDTFPFGAWLWIRQVTFEGVTLWSKRNGRVTLPLEPLTVSSAIWLRTVPDTGFRHAG